MEMSIYQSGGVRIAMPCGCKIIKMAAKREKIIKEHASFKGEKIVFLLLFPSVTRFIAYLHGIFCFKK